MDTSTNKVQIGPIVHALHESGVETLCGLRGVVVTLAPWLSGHRIDNLVDCMTCLVGRRTRVAFNQTMILAFKKPFRALSE